MKSTVALSLAVLFSLLLSSCEIQKPQQNINPSIEIQLNDTVSKVVVNTKQISQPNCTGSAEVESTVQMSRDIEHIIQVEQGVDVSAEGQIGFAGTDVNLGAVIANKYGQSYGITETISRLVTVKAKPGTNMLHTVQEVEIWKVGQAIITVGDQQTTVPFRFRNDFDLEFVDSQNLDNCESIIATPADINSDTVSTKESNNNQDICFPQTGWTPPKLKSDGEWIYDCLSSSEGNWVGQDETWKATNWKKGSSQSEIVTIIVPNGANVMGLGCDPCTVLKPDGTSISSKNRNFGSFKPNITIDVKPDEKYQVKIFGGDTCPTRPTVLPPCAPEIYIWFNLP